MKAAASEPPEMPLLVLGIETSCDETAAAVVDERGAVRSDVIESQIRVHAPYGGIVPELASRDHLKNARPLIETALARAGVALGDLAGIAVTSRPGLSGALLVGVQIARGLAFATELPIVGVDHLLGHLLAAFLVYPDVAPAAQPDFPFVALLASGGHTALYRVDGPEHSQVRELGATRDDAAGEAFDKVAKVLGLGYPGGPIVDRLAHEGDPTKIELTAPMRSKNSLEFSFSGLKTSVARYVEQNGRPGNDQRLRDLCAAFQTRVIDALVHKTIVAATNEGVSTIVLGGGVAANRQLRTQAAAAASKHGLSLCIPLPRACTDNAAMIAYAAVPRLARGESDAAHLEVSPHTALPRVTRKGPGTR
jgi:N6-L-threonylcarbamoyladenine synthase